VKTLTKEKNQLPQKDRFVLPEHVAIIMDGNRRWAKKNGFKFFFGHKKGVDAFEEILKYLYKKGVKIFTVYAFSTENWKREKDQVSELMKILSEAIIEKRGLLFENNISLNILGDLEKFPEEIKKNLQNLVEETKSHTGLILNTALNYGGRDEIIRTVKKLILKGVSTVDEESFSSLLDTKGMVDPDMIIRTGGAKRLSNFMLWQGSYSEIFFTDTLWPDFDIKEMDNLLGEYILRKRNFGK